MYVDVFVNAPTHFVASLPNWYYIMLHMLASHIAGIEACIQVYQNATLEYAFKGFYHEEVWMRS